MGQTLVERDEEAGPTQRRQGKGTTIESHEQAGAQPLAVRGKRAAPLREKAHEAAALRSAGWYSPGTARMAMARRFQALMVAMA